MIAANEWSFVSCLIRYLRTESESLLVFGFAGDNNREGIGQFLRIRTGATYKLKRHRKLQIALNSIFARPSQPCCRQVDRRSDFNGLTFVIRIL